jgi:hypothetical protein
MKKLIVLVVLLLVAGNAQAIFTPPAAASLHSWGAADVGVTKDGSGYISAVADQSGSGNNATQGTGTAQPLWVDGVMNGNPVMRYDGTTDFMQIPSMGDLTNTQLTWFIAAQMVSTGAGEQMLIEASNAAPTFYYNAMKLGVDAADDFYGQYKHDSTNSWKVTDGAIDTDTHVLSLRRINFGAMDLNVMSLGSTVSNTVNVPSPWCNIIGPVTLGAQMWKLQMVNFANVDIAEVLLYRGALSDADRTTVETYLYDKYIVPEPATVVLLSLGGLLLRRRRA